MTALVLGATGQIGRYLRELLPNATFWSRRNLDLDRPERVGDAVADASPSVLINAAAYTAVDGAETEPEPAWRVNAASVAAMAMTAARLDIPLIHVSTDYVFDGTGDRPYRSRDGAFPLNVYGRTKLAGDLAVTALCSRYWILRPSWVFSEHGRNFVTAMLRLGRAGESIRVVNDQLGRPCFAGDVARLIVALAEPPLPDTLPPAGLYHIGGGPEVSWHDFAATIFEHALAKNLIHRTPPLTAVSSDEYLSVARRPRRSTLQPDDGFQARLGVIPDWVAGLDLVLDRIGAQSSTAPPRS